jgi:hypothetical protein
MAALSPKQQRSAWKRSAEDALRIYGPREFREWLHRQLCAVCGSRIGVQQMHAKGDGAARKASWLFSFPGCALCHHEQHAIGVKTFEKRRQVVLLDLAAKTQRDWAAFSGASA